MSTRFEKVIQQASTLPAEIQDEIAEQWLEDIENELNWQKTLQQPQDKLAELAREALRQSARGETLVKGFDEI
jgi:cell division protein FtsB